MESRVSQAVAQLRQLVIAYANKMESLKDQAVDNAQVDALERVKKHLLACEPAKTLEGAGLYLPPSPQPGPEEMDDQ